MVSSISEGRVWRALITVFFDCMCVDIVRTRWRNDSEETVVRLEGEVRDCAATSKKYGTVAITNLCLENVAAGACSSVG